jgi:intracellular sulfur oxidation DsrE/DsrF family protein
MTHSLRRLLPLMALYLGTALFSFANAAESKKTQDFALLISQPRHVKGVLKMFEDMRSNPKGLQYEKARIVLYGEAIMLAKKGSELEALITESHKFGVTVAVCEQAMERLKLKASELQPITEPVKSAIYEMLRLKTLGYISLDL